MMIRRDDDYDVDADMIPHFNSCNLLFSLTYFSPLLKYPLLVVDMFNCRNYNKNISIDKILPDKTSMQPNWIFDNAMNDDQTFKK